MLETVVAYDDGELYDDDAVQEIIYEARQEVIRTLWKAIREAKELFGPEAIKFLEDEIQEHWKTRNGMADYS